MTEVETKLEKLGLVLPPASTPAGNYVPATRSGNLVFLSGHGPIGPDGKVAYRGRVGDDLSREDGYEAAKLTALALLRSLKAEIGDLDRVTRILKVLGMVRCTPDFSNTPGVINGASDLFVELYGERGRHARSAVGLYELPMHIPVEIEMIVEVEP